MEIQFYIGGSLVSRSKSDVIPLIGSEVEICMETYKKGMFPGTVLRFTVSEEFPPKLDSATGNVAIDVNGWTVAHEAPAPKEN